MNPILKALGLGYAANQVLEFMGKAFPALLPRIKKAKSVGYTTDQILDLLQRGMGPQKGEETESQYQSHARQTQQSNAVVQDLLKLAGGAAATYGTARLLGAALPSFKSPKAEPPLEDMGNAGPSETPPPEPSSPPSPSGIGPKPMGGAPIQPKETAPISPAAVPTTEKTPTPAEPISAINAAKEKSNLIIKSLGAEDLVKKGVQEGKTPKEIALEIQKNFTPEQRREYFRNIIRGKEPALEEHIKEFVYGPEGLLREDIVKFGNSTTPQTSKSPSHNLNKGDVVYNDNTGKFGEIKDIRKSEGLLEENGKLHKSKLDELEKPPEDLIKAVTEILKIPDVDKSSVISLATYRPSQKQLFIQFHNGETYAYEDVPESMGQEIAHALGVAKTSGKNIFGAWDEGVQSRGAALIHKIIRDPKYSKENEGKTWEKLGTYYDFWNKLRKHGKRKK